MFHLLFILVSAEMALVLVLLFSSPLRKLVIKIQKRALEGGVINPTDEVLLANRILEASLMGFALFLALVTYRLHYHIKELNPIRRRLEADEKAEPKVVEGSLTQEHSKKATASRTSDVRLKDFSL
ncbi:uncharacterized protein LOC110419760 isoform X2 [Herrania umbratica]|uniref:Endoplasmic reticulum transmembrane protein n=1 Tax=Herrania umbratica TaxID=108875 RepID=A0A6J1APS1_9ROSI|nr:uncharacterized protein LOC110419760 isoform X2 [Herrania umbratica]